MVTMPSEAADDSRLVEKLLPTGMDCVRINSAHDGPDAWARMIANLRRAEQAVGRKCRDRAQIGVQADRLPPQDVRDDRLQKRSALSSNSLRTCLISSRPRDVFSAGTSCCSARVIIPRSLTSTKSSMMYVLVSVGPRPMNSFSNLMIAALISASTCPPSFSHASPLSPFRVLSVGQFECVPLRIHNVSLSVSRNRTRLLRGYCSRPWPGIRGSLTPRAADVRCGVERR